MQDRLSKLVNAINRVGIGNVALLSRLTGIPPETVRYMIKKRFPELGLFVGLHVDYDRLGLERNFAVLEFTPDSLDNSTALLKKLSEVAFLTYHAREVLRPRYTATFGIPVNQKERFHYFLDRLVKEKILLSFKLERIEWTRHLALRAEYCDFENQSWKIDWDHVASLKEPPPSPPMTIEPSPQPNIDTTDLLLIKEFELQSWRHISDVSRKLNLNDRTARWHYTKHVSPMINSHFVRRWPPGSKGLTKIVGLIHEFNGLSTKKLATIRRLFNNFPFTWNENGRKDGYYLAVSTVPSEYFVESSQFLNSHLQNEISVWETYTLDLSLSKWYTIPYGNFDDELGWQFDLEKALNTVIAVKIGKK